MQFATHNDSLMLGSPLTCFCMQKKNKKHLELERWRKLWEQMENKTTVLLCSATIMHLIC